MGMASNGRNAVDPDSFVIDNKSLFGRGRLNSLIKPFIKLNGVMLFTIRFVL